MEACDGYYSMGTSDDNKYLVIKQNIETKLNEELFYVSSRTELRNRLNINKTQYDELLFRLFVDNNGYRYSIMQIPYWMQK